MNTATIKIADIKIADNGKLIPVTSHPSYRHVRETLTKLDHGYKPKTPDERRTKHIYDSVKARGWNPQLWGHIQTYRQHDETILWSGTHRLATLTHLGHTETIVQITERQYLKRVLW